MHSPIQKEYYSKVIDNIYNDQFQIRYKSFIYFLYED